MGFNLRALNEISASVRGAFRQYLPGTDATLLQNFVGVVGKVLALLSREYELRLKYLYLQLFVRLATDEAVLRMHGADLQIFQKPAAASSGLITGAGQAGATWPAGVRWISAGVTYVSTAPFTAGGGGGFSAQVRAETASAATNRDEGAVMTLADPSLYPSLSQDAEVSAAGLGGGADVEDIESLRARILARKSRPPQGGALPDYETFALEVPGVLKAWAWQFTNGIGSIAVYVLFKGRVHRIPTGADVAAVQAYIDARRLIRVDDLVAVAPVAAPVVITISDLVPDTPVLRAAIEDNLAAMFLERARPGVLDAPFVLERSWVSEAISTAAGEDSHALVSPAANLSFTGGRIPVLGGVTYA